MKKDWSLIGDGGTGPHYHPIYGDREDGLVGGSDQIGRPIDYTQI